jgi:predicted nuclease of predicted toxin-antitoxin system
MAAIKVYLDEDVHAFIAHALRLRSWEALTTQEAGRRRDTDLDQIAFASEQGYAILTYNIRDFPRLHTEILAGGKTHAGLIVGTRQDPRGNIRALLNLLHLLSAEDLVNQLVYLNNWL